jgi:hypothetical protein
MGGSDSEIEFNIGQGDRTYRTQSTVQQNENDNKRWCMKGIIVETEITLDTVMCHDQILSLNKVRSMEIQTGKITVFILRTVKSLDSGLIKLAPSLMGQARLFNTGLSSHETGSYELLTKALEQRFDTSRQQTTVHE